MSEGELTTDARLRSLAISDWAAVMAEWIICLKSRAGLHVIRSFLDCRKRLAKLPSQG